MTDDAIDRSIEHDIRTGFIRSELALRRVTVVEVGRRGELARSVEGWGEAVLCVVFGRSESGGFFAKVQSNEIFADHRLPGPSGPFRSLLRISYQDYHMLCLSS